MSLRVYRERLISRLIDRFDIRDKPGITELIQTILMVTDVDELLKEIKIESVTSVTRAGASGAGATTYATVPTGERWNILAIHAVRSAGDGTLEHANVLDTHAVRVATQTAAANFTSDLLSQPIPLDERQSLYFDVAAISTDSTWSVRLLYILEEAF